MSAAVIRYIASALKSLGIMILVLGGLCTVSTGFVLNLNLAAPDRPGFRWEDWRIAIGLIVAGGAVFAAGRLLSGAAGRRGSEDR